MTGSELMLGVVSFAGQIPTFLLAPFAGVITDRWSRYRVLLVTQLLSLIQASILAGLTLAGSIEIWQIVILSVIFGCINAFDVPTRHSFVVQMVENKEDLGNAIALNSLMFNGARLIGPSIAGLILAVTSEGFCFLINAISYLFVIGSLMMMRISYVKEAHEGSRMLKDLREGLDYAFGFPPIKNILLLLSVVSLTGMSYQVLMPVFADKILQGGSETYGFLMGAAGLGALAGALHLASRTTVLRLGRLISFATLAAGIGLILLSFSKIYIAALLIMMVIGTGMMLQSAASNTILQTITDDDKRGRVMSFYTMAVMGTAPFGSLLSGSLAKVIGTQGTVLIFGICTIAGALFFQMRLPEMRKIVHPIYVKMGIIREVAEGMQSSEGTV